MVRKPAVGRVDRNRNKIIPINKNDKRRNLSDYDYESTVENVWNF